MFPQVPAAVLAALLPPQYSHAAVQALLQQTPSAQKPVRQSAGALQDCPCFFLQTAFASQLRTPLQLSGSSAFFTSTQVPLAPVQARHSPQDDPQHIPSVQDPLMHSPAPPQALPLPFFATQTPPLQ